MKKISQEEFLKRAKEIHGEKYDFSKIEYKGAKLKICIICPEHGEFWIEANRFLQGQGCPKCGTKRAQMKNRMKQEDFIKRATEVHNGKYDYSKVQYENTDTKVCIICPEHGEFWQTPHHHLKGTGCPQCSSNKIDVGKWKNEAQKIHGEKYDYSLIYEIKSKEKVKIICPKHGIFIQNENNHLQGRGCPHCFLERKTATKEEFIEKAKKIHGNKYDYSKIEYVNSHIKVLIICPEHGEFWQTPADHLNGKGCPDCGKMAKSEISLYEDIKSIYPDTIHIYRPDFLFNNGKPQSLDIYIPSLNTAIEYQGRQHFMPVSRYGGKEGFIKTKERDLRKFNLCKENNVRLLYASFEKEAPKEYLSSIYSNKEELLKELSNGRY